MELVFKFLALILVTGAANEETDLYQQLDKSENILCANGDVVPRWSVCDGVVDCKDGSDERYSGAGLKCYLSHATKQQHTARCLLPDSMLRDGIIDCIDGSDLCYDKAVDIVASRCFLCLDGSMAISLTQVCDGTVDCPDLSDECACVLPHSEHVWSRNLSRSPICDQLKYVIPFNDALKQEHNTFTLMSKSCPASTFACDGTGRNMTTVCLELQTVCDDVIHCPLGDDEKYCGRFNFSCSGDKDLVGTYCDGRADCPNFDDECNNDCWLPNNFCHHVTRMVGDSVRLSCAVTNGTANASSITNTIGAESVCDGVVNCVGSDNDEAHCLASTHFYCSGNSSDFIHRINYLDGKRDCELGTDECGEQTAASRVHALLSRDAMIRSGFMICTVFVFGIMALIGNAAVFRHASSELWDDIKFEKLGKLAKCNRILVANLAISDFLMGVYLITIGMVSVISDGRYCVNDRHWRSGLLCSALGCLCQLSSQTSVFTIVLMTSFRLYGTLRPFKAERSNVVYRSLIACAIIWIISIFLSVIPLLDTFSDYFNSHIWIPLPMLPSDVINLDQLRELVVRMNTLTYAKTGAITDFTVPNMLKYIKGIGIKGINEQWDPGTIRPYGFYNSYPLCMPNFYPTVGDAGWVYSITIVTFDAISIFYITVAYFVIYKASSRPAVRKSVRIRSKQWRKDNKSMQKKILLLVITDVTCWMPICVMAFVNVAKPIPMRRDIIGITGGFLLPINSAMNPLIYSTSFWQGLESIKNRFRKKDATFELYSRESSVLSQSQASSDIQLLQRNRLQSEEQSTKTDGNQNPASTTVSRGFVLETASDASRATITFAN